MKHWTESVDPEDAAQAVLDHYGGVVPFQQAMRIEVTGIVDTGTRLLLIEQVERWLTCDHLYLEHVPGCVRCGKP